VPEEELEAAATPPDTQAGIGARIDKLDWERLGRGLEERGYVVTPALLSPAECAALVALWEQEACFRKRVDMARQRFGEGVYKYFADPLPPIVRELRASLYRRLAPVANRWRTALRLPGEPLADELTGFLELCHRHGQLRPTPLLLRYEAGGYNCLHQDLYGEIAFPLQATFVLSRRGAEYRGGQFLLLEDRPRAQARGYAIELEQGEAIIFASTVHPVSGKRGYYRTRLRHGVSPLLAGVRLSLGIIFHDAR